MATTKGNLFASAKRSAPTKAVKENKKVRISIENQDFFDKIKELEILQDNMKSDKAKADMISDEIKDIGKEKWAELYEKTGRNPESVMLEERVAGNVGQAMFLVSDKYISINEERAETLRSEYGDEIVEEKTVFTFDAEMIDKYGEILSRLIEESNEISEEDKTKIVKASTSFSIKKGAVDEMKEYGDVKEVMEAIRPIVSLKNVEVIKG